ncbi:MAG: hypothetical protein Q9187_007821, partial [Circinaria calcarea]
MGFATASNLQTIRSLDKEPVLHFPISRRGGAFANWDIGMEVADLTYLEEELRRVEERYNLTRREAKGNKYANIGIGEPPQPIEMDLDLLTSDFYVLTTTSARGSKYVDLFSKANVKSHAHPFPGCGLPTDSIYLPQTDDSVPLAFAYCHPSKSSAATLGPSGSLLGLAPSEHLRQMASPTFLKQLLDKGVIRRNVFSILLINGNEGVLSIGGTAAQAIRLVEQQTRDELDRVGMAEAGLNKHQELLKRGSEDVTSIYTRGSDWREGWSWSKVQGAEGWWQVLMQGVLVDGVRVLKNQPVVIDINSPFILAPPFAARAFYASISGSLPLASSPFYLFPCLNPPVLEFEFEGGTFPVLQGSKGADWVGMPGGRLNLGRLEEGSGYCVGAVVETRMGVGEDGGMAGNGMRDVWVLGEGFFRGVGGVFD